MASLRCTDSKPRRSRASLMNDNALLLKDYLLDDLNCSSSSFQSFPRTRCCATVRFLVDQDLKSTRPTKNYVNKTRRRTTATSTAISAFQKASEAVLNAVKHLSVHNRSSVKSGFLARSFSRKVFKRTFWKNNVDGRVGVDGEMHSWKTFHNLMSEFPETPSHCIPTTPLTTATTTAVTTSFTWSNTVEDDENRKSSSWSENEISSECVQKSGDRSGGEHGEDSMDKTAARCFFQPVEKKDWMATDEKEQFSPVSVLESPFHGDDRDRDHVSSPELDSKLVKIEGTRKKLMQRLRRFEALVEIEPIDLEKTLAAFSEFKVSENNEIENLDTDRAQSMLEHVKSRTMHAQSKTSSVFCADSLLMDFFMDSFHDQTYDELTEAAESYVTGQGKKMMLDWKVEESRKGYIKEMEMGGNWKNADDQRAEVAMEIEESIWRSLVNEMEYLK